MYKKSCWAVALVMASVSLFANGGPWEWTAMTARGNPNPRAATPVKLLSESLHITLDEDGRHYQVRAEYRLKNPGKALEVRYAVPLLWGEDTPDAIGSAHSQEAFWKSFRLEQDGKRIACVMDKDSVGKAKAGPGDSDMDSDWVEFKQAVCTGVLKFSPKTESRLLLAYQGELEFEDSGTTKSALPDFSERTLRYALFPAGFWAGPAEKVEIVVELGRFASRTDLKRPLGGKLVGSEARWLLENVDLKKIPWLEISVVAGDLLRGDFLIHFNRNCQKDWFCFKAEMRASSELTEPDGVKHPVILMSDGRVDTAWCARHDDKQPRLFLTASGFTGKGRDQCGLQGVAVIPGYAKNQRIWMGNQRITELIITKCDDTTPIIYGKQPSISIPIENMTAELPVFFIDSVSIPAETRSQISLGELAGPTDHLCLQIIPEWTTGGGDLCISELSLIFNCG